MEEDTHYCLKCGSTVIGIDNYITHRKVTCESTLDGKMDMSEHAITDTFSCEKPDTDKNKESDHVQADDFFSSLELQSSSKSSSNMISLSFPNKLSGGIVTRSKSLSVVHPEIPKIEPIPPPPTSKYKKKSTTKKKNKGKKEVPKVEATTSDDIGAFLKKSDDLDEKCGEKDDDEWLLFSHLGLKKSNNEETDDKLEIKKSNEQVKRYTPELFSMSPILMPDVLSEGKDVGNFLEDDYDDSYLHIDEMDEFNYAPPRTHTGGKWKPGSLSMRASPILWPGQNWEEALLDDKHQDDEKRAETIDESSNDKKDASKPPATHTGGKWKPTAPPSTHTGGKWKPSEPPATHTGGKWRPESRNGNEPPATHTGGKWKPHPGPNHTSGKWKPEEVSADATHSKTMNAIASCQSTSGKCLKTAGGLIQYYCAPCDRRLASKKMYKKHVLSELHFKRVLQENDLEFDSRSLKVFRGLFTAVGYKERGLGKRTIKRPEHFKEMDMSTGKRVREIKTEKPKRNKIIKKELIRCDVCKTKVPSHQLGKHLVSYYHSRRIQLSDPIQQKLVLDNIHAIVLQAPFQCGICKFYCNTHAAFKKHWADTELHKESSGRIFWCSFCNFECKTPSIMELHLDSNSHREVISAVNKSIPIIIRQKNVLNCKLCPKTFRFNRELSRHNRIKHGVNEDNTKHFRCPVCKYKARGIKSLQRHIILSHKNRGKTPYFCNACNMTFESADEAMRHRKTQYHKCKSLLKNVDVTKVPEEEFFMSRLCHYCGRIQDDLGKLKDHINEEHPNLRPKCAKCGKIFTLSQEVSRHIRDNLCNFSQEEENNEEEVEREVNGEIHRCKLCKYTSAYKSELLFHQAMHDKGNKDKNPVKMKCPLCKKFFRRFALKVHLRTHTGERPYLCKFCPRSFVRRDRLNQHLRADHEAEEKQLLVEQELKREVGQKKEEEEDAQDSEGDVSDDKEQGRAKCGNPKCKYTPKDAEDLAEHVKIHVGPNLFQCPTCGYKAKTNTLFKRHNKIHLDERSYPCPHCSFRGRLASHLKRHMRLHTGAKPYKCPHCSYKCNILENLRKHVLYTKIHPGKCLYECKLCDFSNNSAKDFKLHLYDNHYDHFKTDYNITAYVSGIYCREDDPLETASPLPAKKRASPQPKTDRPEILNKVSILTRKCEKIAPKPALIDKPIVTPSLTFKNTGNSIEDKRKLLQLELLKLRQQAKKKQTETTIKFYPSPTALKAEKQMKIRLEEEKRRAEEQAAAAEEDDEEMEITEILNPPIKSIPPNYTILTENGLVYLKVPSATVISLENEKSDEIMLPGKEVEDEEEVEEKTDEVLEGNASPTYIFYDESDIITEESEEMLVGEEFYVLQD